MNITEEHPSMVWSTLDELSIGDHYCLGPASPTTYLVVDRARGRAGRLEIDAVLLIGPGSKPIKRTYWHRDQQVLIIEPQHVGQRLADAAVAFAQPDRLGSDRIELSASSWPACLEAEIEGAA
ncbi:hypothetical protein D3I60_05080 [Brevibacterium permense]|nr:hypothetical protein [Brevibacterium permense]